MSFLTNVLGFITIFSFIAFLGLMAHFHFDSGRPQAQFTNPYLDDNLQTVIRERNEKLRGQTRRKWHPAVKIAFACYLCSFIGTVLSYQFFGV